MMTNKPVAIIGAGIAGLTAANFLRSQGVPIALFEAGPKIAGLAQSFADKDGFSYDFGAHFVTNRLAAAIGVATQCRDAKYYGESVSLRGRYYGYPFGLMQVPRFLSSALRAKLWCGSRPVTASDHFINAYGEALAKEVALPIIEAWSGAPSHELAASVGSKFSHNIGYTMYLAAMSRYKGVAISSGYCNEILENPQVWHVYPEGGVATLCQRFADPIRDAVEVESPVEDFCREWAHRGGPGEGHGTPGFRRSQHRSLPFACEDCHGHRCAEAAQCVSLSAGGFCKLTHGRTSPTSRYCCLDPRGTYAFFPLD